MAKPADITLGVDDFFINSRLRACLNSDCRFQERSEANCALKYIRIGQDGKCLLCEPRAKKEEEP